MMDKLKTQISKMVNQRKSQIEMEEEKMCKELDKDNRLSKFLNSIDLYGMNMGLGIGNKNEQLTTIMGGVMTLIMATLMVTHLTSEIITLYNV